MRRFALPAILIGLGVLTLGWAVGCHQSVRAYLDDHCRYTGMTTDRGGHRARGYDCPKAPGAMARAVRSAHRPADARASPSGYFLRYRSDMVGILPGRRGASSSRALLADERNGYGYFNNYVGGWWGTYSGPGESFRGGGPGGGK